MILFVCTGNIFRSMTAEYALRRELGPASSLQVASAGTEDYPYAVWSQVRDYLAVKGLDVRMHRRRTATRELVDAASLVVAMSTDHQRFLEQRFGLRAALFLELCTGERAALPDIEEVVRDYRTNAAGVQAHIARTIDTIIELTPRLAARLEAQTW